MGPDLDTWEPLAPSEVAALFAVAPCPWWIAGGWAIDLFVGHQTREHADIDVLVLRDDLAAVQQALRGWDLFAADPPGHLRRWDAGERLAQGVQDVWCRRTPSSPWSLQLVVDDASEGTWRYRRDARVTRPVTELHGNSRVGHLRVLSPDVQLLHKSHLPRPKDEADFRATEPLLGPAERAWLVRSLELASPDHTWLTRLGE